MEGERLLAFKEVECQLENHKEGAVTAKMRFGVGIFPS